MRIIAWLADRFRKPVREDVQASGDNVPDTEVAARSRLQAAVGADLVEFILNAGDAAVGKPLRDIGLPNDCLIISIHRGGGVVVPRGHTYLLAGDRIIVLKVATPVEILRAILRKGPQPPVTDASGGC